MTIVVIGASTGPGRRLFENLRDSGRQVVGIARQQRDLETSGHAEFLSLDASNAQALHARLNASDTLVHCSRPEILTGLLAFRPRLSRIIALGSTRVYTRYPDDKCARVAAMSHALWMQDIPATILHPTMIYGAPGLNNIERVAVIARRFPLIPLPAGGDSLIQPVHVQDVVDAILACLDDNSTNGRTMIIPGGSALTYRTFIEDCIEFAGAECRVVSMPYWLISMLGWIATALPFLPAIRQDEIRRLLEDKAFDAADATRLLGRKPLAFGEGLNLLKST